MNEASRPALFGPVISACALLVLVLEAARRSIGLVLAAITTAFLIYPFISPILPGVFFVAAAVVGFARQNMSALLRAFSFVAGVMLLLQGWQTDILGAALALSLILFNKPVRQA